MGLDPVSSTLIGAAVATEVVGVGMQFFGAKKAGKAAQQAEDYNASLSEYNAQVSEQNVELARRAGVEKERELTVDYAQLKGLQETGYSKAGVKFEGTPASVMLQSAKDYQSDILKTRYNTQIGMQQEQSQAQYYKSAAEYQRWLGKQKKSQYDTSATASLLRGAGDILSQTTMRTYPYMNQ